MATFKHRKKRNAGLVYEFLVRRLSQAMVDQDRASYQKSLGILRKYYSEGIIAEERELFEVIRNTRGVTESAARRILEEVWAAARRMDSHRLDIKKSNLLKEVNYSFGPGFFTDYRIPDYRLLASVQMSLDTVRSSTPLVTESIARIQLEEGLVQYMMTKGSYSVQTGGQSEVDALVMRMAAKKFEEKYSRTLSGPQKALLEKYIRAQVTGDTGPLLEGVMKERGRVQAAIEKSFDMQEVKDDHEMERKLTEAYVQLTRSGTRRLDEEVEDLMLYQKLVEELDSNE
jgi:hypothetical protein